MKKLDKYLSKKAIAFGASMFLLGGTIIPAVGAGWIENIQVRMGLNLDLDGKIVKPVDASGQEMPVFLYQSTTYVPVRYISENYGKKVEWEPESATVHIQTPASESTDPTPSQPSIPDVLPTYLVDLRYSQRSHIMTHEKPSSEVTVSGVLATNGLEFSLKDAQIIYDIEGKYKKLDFDLGYIDSYSAANPGVLTIMGTINGQEKQLFQKTITKSDSDAHYTVDITGVTDIKFMGSSPAERFYSFIAYNILLS